MSNPYLLNRYGHAALHAEFEEPSQTNLPPPPQQHSAVVDDLSDDNDVDASIGFSRFPNAAHLRTVVFQPTALNNSAALRSSSAHEDVVVLAPPDEELAPTERAVVSTTPTNIDIEALIAATRAAMATAAALMHEDRSNIEPPPARSDTPSEESVSPVSSADERPAVEPATTTVVEEELSRVSPPAVFRLTETSFTAEDEEERRKRSLIAVPSADGNSTTSPLSKLLVVSLLAPNEAQSLLEKINRRRPVPVLDEAHQRVHERREETPSNTEQQEKQKCRQSTTHQRSSRKSSRGRSHHRSKKMSKHHHNHSEESLNNNHHGIPLRALESILQTVRTIAAPTSSTPYGSAVAARLQEEAESWSVPSAQPHREQPQSDLPRHEVTLHPHVTFAKPIDAAVPHRPPTNIRQPLPATTPREDVDERIVPTEQLPAVGLSLLPDSIPPRASSRSPSRNVSSRLMQPTQSWIHKGPEYQGIHLKAPPPSRSSKLVTTTDETKDERVSHFNRAASRALRIHSHVPPSASARK